MRKALITMSGQAYEYTVPSLEAWQEVARAIVPRLKPDDILALSGALGAGKTTFVQALAEALGSSKRPQSPTFALMRVYPVESGAIRRLVHVDAYRLENEKDALALNLDEELADGETVLAIEWPENLKAWLSGRETIKVVITE